MSDDPRINLLEDHFVLNNEPAASPWKMGTYFFGTIFLGALIGIAFSFAMTRTEIAESNSESGGFFHTVASFVTSSDRPLEGEEEDRVNVIVYGHGGAGHDGPELTDTIIFGSYEPSTGSVGMMSIPRDLTIPIPGYGWRKINHTNYFGELEDPENGARFASNVIGDLLGQEINYYLKIDFDGFEQFIDALGGVDVFVERSFSDYQYPTDDYLIQTVHFEEGWQHMDGERALMFARSRHGTNGEGSDFARSKRQQVIMLAVKDRLFSPTTVFHPGRVTEIVSTIRDNIQTNLGTWELLRLARKARDIDIANVQHTILDTGIDSPLYETNINGSYVILPENDDWTPIQELATNVINPSDGPVAAMAHSAPPTQQVRIAIENGTAVNGLAFRTSQLLEGQGFEITNIANAEVRDFDHTIIYDLSDGAYPRELRALQEYLKADVATTITGWLFADNVTPRSITLDDEGLRDGRATEQVDFFIILGQNSAHFVRQ